MRSALQFAALLLSLTVACAAPTPSYAQSAVRLTILHTNDTHGHLKPFSYPETFDAGSDLANLAVRRDIGGIARRATLAKRIKAQSAGSALLVDAGDICDGTAFSTEYHGDADIAAMSAAGYDAACPGNHELNNTLQQVHKMVSSASFPIVCANAIPKAGAKPPYAPYVLKKIRGITVALLGLLTPSAASYPAAKQGLAVEAPATVARRLVPALRREADLIVVLSHLGADEDRQLATAVDGIDIIVGGHSHTRLASPLFIGAVPTTEPLSVNGTIIVQNFQWGGTLGRLDVSLRRGKGGRWSVNRYSGKLLTIDSRLPEDPGVAAVVDRYWQPIAAKYGQVVGSAGGDFAQEGQDYAEYSLVADASREMAGSEFDLQNMGGVRSPLPRGPITYADVMTIDPFSNTVVTFKITGRELRRVLEESQPAVSGLRYEIADGRAVSVTVNGVPLDDDRTYTGSTNSFMAGNVLAGVPGRIDTGKSRQEAIIAYLGRHKPAQPQYDGRRIIR